MKNITLTLALVAITLFTAAQVAPDKYFVRFTDKNNSPYSIDNPSEYLSQRAIDRRIHQGIPIDQSDLPVNPSYLAGVAETGATIINPSKWLNGTTVYAADPSIIEAIEALPYVLSVSFFPEALPGDQEIMHGEEKSFFRNEIYNQPAPPMAKQGYEIGVYDYGLGLNQIQMLGGDVFHQMGYRGQGMVIAVLDAGFLNANTHEVFDSLWLNNQILGTRDFVRGGEVQYDEHPHGAMVLSCMGGNAPGSLIGTAPAASYWLLRSEDGGSEYIIEEYNWVSAAEYADSVGVDVINSSLGYTTFNDPSQNHTYQDMNGDTAPVTIGADMAAKKGILVVNSLGNEGGSSWYYLSAPSDGDSVMGIGAVDGSGNYASFSSHGPSYDGRVKPDVVAQGSGVVVADPSSGNYTFSGGTSFSSPILAGMAACLWQANPSLNNMQIAQAIRQSASQYNNPDDQMGHGIPDFVLANNILTVISGPEENDLFVNIYPNPVSGEFTIEAGMHGGMEAWEGEITVEITDITGRLIGIQKENRANSGKINVNLLQNAPAGLYFVRLSTNGYQSTIKIVKN
jgi:hypothetical protein